jgi:hypothetical protein
MSWYVICEIRIVVSPGSKDLKRILRIDLSESLTTLLGLSTTVYIGILFT